MGAGVDEKRLFTDSSPRGGQCAMVRTLATHQLIHPLTLGLALLAAVLVVLMVRLRREVRGLASMDSEEMLRAVTATAQDAIVMADDNGRVCFWNDAAERMFGYTTEEAQGRAVYTLVAPEHYHEAMRAGLARFRKSGEGDAFGQMLRVMARHRDGSEFPIEHSLTAVTYKGRRHAVAVLRDVSERKRAEEALLESERRFRAIADYSYDWEFWLGKDSQPRWVNSAVERMVGYSAQECLSMKGYPLPMAIDEDKSTVARHIDAASKGDFDNEVEFRVLCKNGAIKWVAVSYQPIFDVDESFIGSRWSVREITGRKQAEDGLRRSEAIIRAIVDTSLDCIVTMDHDGNLVEFNPAAEAVFGYTREEAVGHELAELIIPDALRDRHRQGLKRFLEKGEGPALNQRLELMAVRKDGTEFPVELAITVIETDSDPLFTGYLRDITDRKKAEEELKRNHDLMRTVSRLRSLYIGEADRNLLFDTVLKDLLELTGSQYGAISELTVAEDGGSSQERLATSGLDLKGDQQSNAHLRPFDGFCAEVVEKRWPVIVNDPAACSQDSVSPPNGLLLLRNFLGMPVFRGTEVIGSIGLANCDGGYDEALAEFLQPVAAACSQIIDAFKIQNERRLAEEALAIRSDELERSNAELQQFAYVASHDLQEPLRMVTSYMGLLEQRYSDKLDAQGMEFIGFAADGASRMQRLIKDLLEYSRVGTRGKAFAPVCLEKILAEALLNLKARIDECGAEIVHDSLPDLDADDSQIVRLFQNLIGNALKYRKPDAQPRVHVGVKPQNGAWLFSVADNGIGIETQHFDRVFMVFQRLHGRGEYEGTGIGLAVCKKIVERHGGRMWVESTVGEGSTFFFLLPRRHRED